MVGSNQYNQKKNQIFTCLNLMFFPFTKLGIGKFKNVAQCHICLQEVIEELENSLKTKKEQKMAAIGSIPDFDDVRIEDINKEDEMEEIYL